MHRGTVEEMSALRIAEGAVSFAGPVLIVQVSFNDRLKRETAAVRSAFEAAGAGVDVEALVLPPFWSRVDIVDTAPLNDVLSAWAQALALPRR